MKPLSTITEERKEAKHSPKRSALQNRVGHDRHWGLLSTRRGVLESGTPPLWLSAGTREAVVVLVDASGHMPVIHDPPRQQGKDSPFGITVIRMQTRMHPDHLCMLGIQPVDEILLYLLFDLHGPVSTIQHARHAFGDICLLYTSPSPRD